jgi:hypothetical protein
VGEETPIMLRSAIDCAVCRRTLLRGEHADLFRHRGGRRLVCALCVVAATRRGWTPEGGEATLSSRVAARLLRRLLRRGRGEPALPIV